MTMIQTSMVGDVALIQIDDGKANAASHAMLTTLFAALEHASNVAKATVIAGRPGMFSAGFDLKTVREGSEAERDAMFKLGEAVTRKMFSFPRPLLAACTGHGLALGAVWLLCADTRIGAKGDYKFGLNETTIGMALPAFAVEAVRFRLNPAHLTAAAVQSTIYSSSGAVEAGFLDRVIDGDPIAAALEQGQFLARLPGTAYAANKLAFRHPDRLMA